MRAGDFIKMHLSVFMNFDFVDLDDEGTPAREIITFFEQIAGKRREPFVLALTDGNGLNLKLRGKYNPAIYLAGADKIRQATTRDYAIFEGIITKFVQKCAKRNGFTSKQMSTYRGRKGNVIYQTWYISPQDELGFA